jgi:hypothetical protein
MYPKCPLTPGEYLGNLLVGFDHVYAWYEYRVADTTRVPVYDKADPVWPDIVKSQHPHQAPPASPVTNSLWR